MLLDLKGREGRDGWMDGEMNGENEGKIEGSISYHLI